MPILMPMHLADLLPDAIAWQPAAGDLALLAVRSEDLAIAETVLGTLPPRARGQLFVEAESAADIRAVAVPGRIGVTWLLRERGQSLGGAVDAWLAEMLPVDLDREHRVHLWMSGDAAARTLTNA